LHAANQDWRLPQPCCSRDHGQHAGWLRNQLNPVRIGFENQADSGALTADA
jgi:hypothetical protein